jgi:hypothetical protein
MTLRLWNEETHRFEPFSVGARQYLPLSPKLRAQLERIPPTKDGMMKYHPCKVTLKDKKEQDCVYVVDAAEYIKTWGVWPDQDKGKREIRIEEVEEIMESPSRLPLAMAQRLYDAGESGMGYVAFELTYRDGSRNVHVSGNAVDFVRLPDGKTMRDIVDVHPHAGRGASGHLSAPEYYWCLYEKA